MGKPAGGGIGGKGVLHGAGKRGKDRRIIALWCGVARDFIRLDALREGEIVALLERAQEMALMWAARRMPPVLAGLRVALIVDDGGWRNTTAFDLGITAMGGQCVRAPVTLGGRETVADLAAYFDNLVDGIVIRSPELAAVEALAAASVAPEGNILASWIEAAAVLPVAVVQVYPAEWHVRRPAPGFRCATDPGELADADVIVTDCWPRGAPAERLLPYQVTARVLDATRPDTVFLPYPPVTRGQEVADDAMRHARCRVVVAKAFLLHAQNALLEWSLGA